MTQAAFETQVYLLLGLPSTHPRLTTALIRNRLHQTMEAWVREARPGQLRSQAYANLAANSATILMPADLAQPISIKFLDSGGVYQNAQKITIEQADAINADWENDDASSGVQYYYDAGLITSGASRGRRKIGVIPTPAALIANGVEYRYRRQVENLSAGSSSEIIEIPESYHQDLACDVAGFAAGLPGVVSSQNPQLLLEAAERGRQAYLINEDEHRQGDYTPSLSSQMAVWSTSYWDSL